MDRAKVIQEIPYRTWSNGTSTLDTKEGSLGDLCPLSAEAAWNDFESFLTCVTWPSFWRPLRQPAQSDLKLEHFPPGPGVASMAGTLSRFSPSLHLRAVKVCLCGRGSWGPAWKERVISRSVSGPPPLQL